MKVALVGDSLIKRIPNNMLLPNMKKFGKGGAKAEFFLQSEEMIQALNYQPQVTFILIGGNDIRHGCSPKTIFDNIMAIRSKFVGIGSIVKVIEIPYTSKPRGMNSDEFRSIQNSINKKLRRHTKETVCLGGINLIKTYLDIDGVHLKYQGIKNLVNRIIFVVDSI